jgi:hypothetical protein
MLTQQPENDNDTDNLKEDSSSTPDSENDEKNNPDISTDEDQNENKVDNTTALTDENPGKGCSLVIVP